MNRPTLIPGLPRVWRGPDELQLGSDPARALLLHLPNPRAAGVLDLLDGSRTESLVLMRAAEMGVSADDCRELLDALGKTGLAVSAPDLLPLSLPAEAQHRLVAEASALALRRVVPPAPPPPFTVPLPPAPPSPSTSAPAWSPAPRSSDPPDSPDPVVSAASPMSRAMLAMPALTLRGRLGARVVLAGSGRLGAPIAVALAQAGIGHVYPDISGNVSIAELPGGPLCGSDVGRPRCEAVSDAVSRAAPATAVHPVRRWPVTLVIQLDYEQPVTLLATAYASRNQPYLAVTIREGVVVVGPLVSEVGVPCLNCLELQRLDRDPRWPSRSPGLRHGPIEPCTVTTLLAATAFAVSEVLAFIDGDRPETVGGTVEIAAPGRVRRRSWAAHPSCPCSSPPEP